MRKEIKIEESSNPLAGSNTVIRCPWGESDDPLMREYHDRQWGKPCFDERELFTMLTLEGAQAGLSWSLILHRRANYFAAFDNFAVHKVAAYDERKLAELLEDAGIIRNRLKIRSAVNNAQRIIALGSFSDFIWNYVDGKPIVNQWRHWEEVPAHSELSSRISKDMKKLGFTFVGPTVIYSFLQAVGVINDHLLDCSFRF